MDRSTDFETVLEHAKLNEGKETDKVELAKYFNSKSEMQLTVGGLAVNTLIRQAYNHFMKLKKYYEAYFILDTYKPEVYKWKVLNKYEGKRPY